MFMLLSFIITDQHPCPDSPNQTGADRVRAIVAAAVVTAIVMMFMATIAIVAIVLRFKKGTKEGISNPANGKWQ